MNTRQYSSKQEEYVANMLDGQCTPNSGAGHTKKGDVLVDNDYIIECKTKTKQVKNFSIPKEWIDTLKKESLAMNRPYWAIVFDYGKLGDEYVVIPLEDYKEFIEMKREEL